MRTKRLASAMSLVLMSVGFTAALSLSGSAAFASATPPAPRDGGTWNHHGTVTGSAVDFQSSPLGEIDDGYICDTAADGHHAHVTLWNVSSPFPGAIVSADDYAGANTCTEFSNMSSGNYKTQIELDTREGSTNIAHWLSATIYAGYSNAETFTLFAKSSGGIAAAQPRPGGELVVCDTEADGHHAEGYDFEYDDSLQEWVQYNWYSETRGANDCDYMGSVTGFSSLMYLESDTDEGIAVLSIGYSPTVNLS
jgi:hypothetical protein